MAGLFDIAPLSKTINIRGAAVTVRGLSSSHLAVIANDCPALKEALEKKSIETPALVKACLAASGPLIAAAYVGEDGKTHFGNKKTETFAAGLCLADQIQIMIPILELTLPGIARPLALALSRISLENSEGDNVPAAEEESEVSATG